MAGNEAGNEDGQTNGDVAQVLISSIIPGKEMRTLFGKDILSPPPLPVPQRNEFDLSFRTALSNPSNASEQSSPSKSDWLTQLSQSQSQPEGQTTFTHGEQHVPPAKRKGSPKLLFMGMRRQVGCCSLQ